VRGAFLSDLDQHGTAYWRNAVRNMHRLGMDVAIIQTEAYLELSAGTWLVDAVDRSLIDAVLGEAARHAIGVFVGLALAENGNGDPQAAQDAAFMGALIERSRESATRVHDLYGTSPAFAGFYLPQEPWTPGSRGELGLLPDYLQEVGHHCRRLAPAKQIAVSPFISDLATDPELTETTYASMLDVSAIDVVMLQDGVGARGVEVADLETRVKPYLVAMRAAAEAAGREMWVNVESFSRDAPGPLARLQAQVALARTITPSVVTFDYRSYCLCTGRGSTRRIASSPHP
jgi:hypothetical protein